MTASVLGAGRFEVRGTLGAGGAGVVYRAYDHQLQREVALKLLRTASGRDLYRFKREFRALADIVHPNLVALHELHAIAGDWYFTMELIEGVSFIDWVRPSRNAKGPTRTRQDIIATPVNVARLRGALVQLVDALVALHRAGKLHRDLKPSNVLVTDQGRLALLDFGLVSGVAEGNPERLAVGTPVYMSPEQAADQPLTEASDWYSLGAMVYEALTGRRPFEGEPELVMTRKQTETPTSPTRLVPNLPPDLARLCMAMLAPPPTQRPAGLEILDLLGATQSQPTRDIARSLAPTVFVGRVLETDELKRALADSRRRGVTVMVRGASGIGKSTLIRRFMRSLGDAVFVLEGRCFEREQVPFKMLDGIVDTLTGVLFGLPPAQRESVVPRDLGLLVRLFPVMKRVPELAELADTTAPPSDLQELRRRAFKALRMLLSRIARIKPIVMFVDDIHWGDADSAGFLAELIHESEPSILIILAHRPEDYLGVVAQLRRPPAGQTRRGDVRDLELGGLSVDDSVALVAQLADDSRRATAVVTAAAGNPLVLAEMARAPRLQDGAKMEDLVLARAGRLSVEAQAMLVVTSIAARPLSVELAARAAGINGGHAEAAVLSAERLATLRRVDGHMILQPAHDYVRAAVLGGIDVESKARWHESLAHALEEGGAPQDAQAVVEHWIAAGHPANAAHHALAAAQRAEEALAFLRAAELYEIAITYGPWDAPGRRELMRRKANALSCAGQLDEAAQVLGHAAELVPGEESIDLERLRVEALLRRGRLEEALPAAERLLEHVGVKVPVGKGTSRKKLATQWFQSKLRGYDFTPKPLSAVPQAQLRKIDVLYSISSGLAVVDPAAGRLVQTELMKAAIEAGEPMRVCLALTQEICYAASAGSTNSKGVADLGARLHGLASQLGASTVSGLATVALGIAAYQMGNWRDARGHFEAGLGTLRDQAAGVRWEIDVAESYWLSSMFYLGEWRELVRLVPLLLRDALERGDVVAEQSLRAGRSALAWAITGRLDDARQQVAAAEATLAAGMHVPRVLALQAACNFDLWAGDAAGAARRLDEAWPNIERLGALRIQQLRIELRALRGRIALADSTRSPDDRARLASGIADEIIKENAPWAIGIAELLRAAAMTLRGDVDAAIRALDLAEPAFANAHMAGYLQIARMRRGDLEGGGGGGARAAAARDTLSELGANNPDAIASLLIPWPT